MAKNATKNCCSPLGTLHLRLNANKGVSGSVPEEGLGHKSNRRQSRRSARNPRPNGFIRAGRLVCFARSQNMTAAFKSLTEAKQFASSPALKKYAFWGAFFSAGGGT